MNTYRLSDKLFKPVPSGSLVAFRVLFGLVMLWEVYRYFNYGWIERYWVEPEFNFKYEWFEWVQPLSADGMTLIFYLLGLLSVFIIVGFLYRISTALFFLLFTYTFLLEQARYLNHFYLVILISFIMAVVPAHRSFSVDARLFQNIRQKWVPGWAVFLLQFQIGIVYFFGGIAKLNSDWLSGSPIDMWLPRRSNFPLIGEYFNLPEVIWFVSYSGLLLDLLALPLLLIRKTRPWMALALIFFHLMNDRLFSIGIFPWFMIAALTLFLPPGWPGDLMRYLTAKSRNAKLLLFAAGLMGAFTGAWFHGGINMVPFIIMFLITIVLIWDFHIRPAEVKLNFTLPASGNSSRLITSGLAIWCLIQIVVPLRHFTIHGNPSWTEEGHRFAWHMKLRSKSCNEQIYIVDKSTGERQRVNGFPFLEDWQNGNVSARPQLLIQYASLLSRKNSGSPVYADIECSLNGGPYRKFVDPETDLTLVTFKDWKKNEWVLR